MSQPCMRLCKSCEIIRTTYVTVTNEQTSYKLRDNFNCKSENVVYALTYNQHELKNIIETLTSLTTRLRDHTSSIKDNGNNPVAKHFNEMYNDNMDFYSQALGQETEKKKTKARGIMDTPTQYCKL